MFTTTNYKKEKRNESKTLTSLTTNFKSFHKYHNHSFSIVAIYILFLSSSFIKNQQQSSKTNHFTAVEATTTNLVHLESQQHNNSSNLITNQAAINYLLFSSQQQQDSKLNELLKDKKHSHISDAVNIQLANSVWFKLRKNVEDFTRQRTRQARPIINRLLEDANVTSSCKKSLNDVLDRLDQLDNWAMEMYNAFSDFPATGLFEGTLTSAGSYHQCVNLLPNDWIGRAQYCTFKFQPIVPKRPKYHNILATIDNLANFTNKDDVFNHLAKKAHYYYYTKLRLSTCMPTKCEKNDIELLGKQVAVNTYLQFSGFSCLEKETDFNLDGAQIFAITILISLASISFTATILHLFDLRSFILMDYDHLSASKTIRPQTPLESKTSLTLTHLPDLSSHHNLNTTTTKQDGLTKLQLRLLYISDILLHFSIIANGRKLFDTTTSRRRRNKPRVKDVDHQAKDGATSELLLNGNNNNIHNNNNNNKSNNNNCLNLNNLNITMKEHCSISENAKSASETACSESSDSSSRGSGSTSGRTDYSTTTAVNGPTKCSDISCIHGLRFWTISWIIFGHTMQYNEWAGFGRVYQIEKNITSFFLHPILNAFFSVDTFFLVSGLLTTYVTWSITRGQYERFNKFAFLISRYLRLTPQVLLVVLIYIVFPLMGDGPYWRGLIQKESDNCKKNWWVNALYLQAFIKQDQICNLVTWWLSIEMFYHLISIIVIIALMHSTMKGVMTMLVIGGGLTGMSCYLHYANHYPPTMLPTLIQHYEIWDSIVLKYFWTPYPHAPSYFVGLILGYILYNKCVTQLTAKQVNLGWLTFAVCYLSILFGTYNWNKNEPYSRFTATFYYNSTQIIWPLATGWAIFACTIGHGGWLNTFLSSPLFVPLGRATYMTYLSHMIIVMSYPAKMNMLIEPSYLTFSYIFISNLVLAYSFGIFLTLVYESPILHLQKILVTNMAQKFVCDSNETSSTITNRSETLKDVCVTK